MTLHDWLYVAAGLVPGLAVALVLWRRNRPAGRTNAPPPPPRPASAGRNSGAFTRTEDAFAPVLDAAHDVMVVLAAGGKITFLNRAFRHTTGLSRREWVGRPFTTLVHAQDWARVGEFLRQLDEGQSPPAAEARLLAASGGHVAVELTATPLCGDGVPEGALVLARPATAGKAAAEEQPAADQSQQSQKLEALGRLAGGIAHDFNNLLTVILGYADLMSRYGSDAHAREVGHEIQKAGERAAALTRQLLAFSRKQMQQPVVLDLNGLVRDLDSMLRRLIGEDMQLATTLHDAPLSVKVDPGQMEQVLTNLVVNARDAMPKGGRIVVSTGKAPAGAEDDSWRRGDAGYAVLTVSDGGCGMDEHVIKRLFEPFFTTKEVGKGTGLGLAMVYGIVQQSGGRIEVDSAPDQGSTFRVYLPLTAEPSSPPPERAAPVAAAGGKETVLLVEDEDAVRHLASRTLQSQGYNVLEAADGLAALTVCQRHLRSVDVVVTDVVMPQLSGVELVERLRTVRPGLKVLYISGYNDSTVVRHGMTEAESNYLQKPFTPDELTRKVRDLLDREAVGA